MDQVELEKTLGPFSATMLGVGAMVGAGIFVLSGIAAGYAGPAVILAFLLNAIVALAVGSCYAELSAAMPRAGGSYYWVKTALGRPAGFAVGWISLYANVVVSSMYALGFGTFFVALLQRQGIHVSENFIVIFAVLLTIAVSYLQYRGAHDLGAVENTVTLTKIILLLLLVAGGIAVINSSNEPAKALTPLMPNGVTGLLMAMAVIFVAFEGFEVITRTGEEMHNPSRNMPIAIYASILVSTVLYIAIAVVLVAAISGPDGQPAWRYLGELGELGMATTARQLLPSGDLIFYIAGIASTASAMIASTYSAIRVAFALGRSKDLPTSLAALHQVHHSPTNAVIFCGLLVLVFVLTLPIQDVAGAASQMFALLFSVVCFAAWRLRRKHPNLERPFRAPLLDVCAYIGIAAGIAVMVTLFNITPIAWLVSIAWLGLGVWVYRWRAARAYS